MAVAGRPEGCARRAAGRLCSPLERKQVGPRGIPQGDRSRGNIRLGRRGTRASQETVDWLAASVTSTGPNAGRANSVGEASPAALAGATTRLAAVPSTSARKSIPSVVERDLDIFCLLRTWLRFVCHAQDIRRASQHLSKQSRKILAFLWDQT